MGLVAEMSKDWLCEFDVLGGSCKFLLVVSKERKNLTIAMVMKKRPG